ncbi:hypothetical protein [Streptomyces venezuelae]|uniref:Uncharacterized protein n=1 Tax=Streptomyces venezuelae TaxID=54571 RepID=A0A5P2BIQ1_STRVZ|nr:hypothetical protein [Streptomyces venezuelae]QES29001.1 hypothetical protein DEJ47_23515 [Streptomyces venezuelae]
MRGFSAGAGRRELAEVGIDLEGDGAVESAAEAGTVRLLATPSADSAVPVRWRKIVAGGLERLRVK